MKHFRLVLAGLLLTASVAQAQTLGDVAKQEEVRRKAAKTGKVYTNDNLKADPGSIPPVPAGTGPAASSPSGDQGAKPEAKPSDSEDPKKTEKYWRERVAQARDGLQRAKTFEEALQSRINALSADFAARDDPASRSVVATDRQKALAELERVKKEIADFDKQLKDLEDEARKAGVPPGWLR
jgi:hypothetical protein